MGVLIDPYKLGDANRLLWLRAEDTLGTTMLGDSSIYGRVPVSTSGEVTDAKTKCGSGVFGNISGFRISYSEDEFPVFEDEGFVIQAWWFNFGGSSTERTLWGRETAGATRQGWRLRWSNPNTLIFQTWNSSGTQLCSRDFTGPSMPNGAWYHVALVWTGSDFEVYVNESSLSLGSSSGVAQIHTEPGAEFRIGWDQTFSVAQNYGYIDELTVDRYPRAISSACPL